MERRGILRAAGIALVALALLAAARSAVAASAALPGPMGSSLRGARLRPAPDTLTSGAPAAPASTLPPTASSLRGARPSAAPLAWIAALPATSSSLRGASFHATWPPPATLQPTVATLRAAAPRGPPRPFVQTSDGGPGQPATITLAPSISRATTPASTSALAHALLALPLPAAPSRVRVASATRALAEYRPGTRGARSPPTSSASRQS